jgi:hypothetical protein
MLHAQQVKVYFDKRLPGEDKNAVYEMVGFLKQASSFSFILDSINRFAGSGIYVTNTSLDVYKKAPSALRSMGNEGIYIQGTDKYLYITANSSLALREALFVYLEKLGFRFYFPDPAWFITPVVKSPLVSFQLLFKPSFASREMFMGYGYGSEKLYKQYLFWQRANRMGGAFDVRNEHAYYSLLTDKRKEFEAHPEYLSLPLVNGKRQNGVVLNYGSPELAQLTYEWLAEKFDDHDKKGTPVSMLSLEPFDGNNYCKLPSCLIAGHTASDQVFYFTNQVAKKLKRTHPTKKIGILAYNDHIDIPKYRVEDNIFVTITNGYNTSSYSTDQLIARWRTKTRELGLYDYFSIYASSYDLPGRGLGARYLRAVDLIKKYNNLGVIAFKAETTYGWIPKGLTHYIAAQLTWNRNLNVSKTVDEFFDLCFPQTKKWIRPIIDYWNTDYIMTENDLYQWFTALQNAFRSCDEPTELKRLHQFALYIYYVKLFNEYIDGKPERKTQAGLELSAFLWNVLDEGVVASAAALNSLTGQLGKEYDYFNPKAPWRTYKSKYPQTKKEWLSFIDSYLPTLNHVAPVSDFSRLPILTKEERKTIGINSPLQNPTKTINFRGSMTFILNTRISDSNFVRIRGGRTKKMGVLAVSVYKWNDEMKAAGLPIKKYTLNVTGEEEKIDFKNLPKDRYIVTVTDESSGTSVYFPGKLKFSILASVNNPIMGGVGNTFFFYVPKGTKSFYILKSHSIRIFDPHKKWADYDTRQKLVEIKIDNNAGWWMATLQLENLYFKGIPPLISINPESFYFPE